ncbi:fimbrial protein [Pseudomonas chlororaphis]|uniref:fimbrial protein n=1 Tax=Pseudomonas chlororaphis TaxID=587753 RepID=UPI0030D1B2AF
MRKLVLVLMFLSGLFVREAFAICTYPDIPRALDIVLPSQAAIKKAPIGGELARHEVRLWSGFFTCSDAYQDLTIRISTALKPSAISKVYETGVKGLGVQFCLDWGGTLVCPFFSQGLHNLGNKDLPSYLVTRIIRTGRDVESGKSVPMAFTIDWVAGGAALQVKGQGTTELVNDVYFSGCESVGAAVNVQMGKQTIQHIKNGSVREVPFNFDVRCSGLKSGAKVPVKVYFEGASQGDGMLKLSNLGQAGVASGVGISLVNDKGAKLPFDIARSIGLDWNRDAAEGSIYRFSGKAKYTPTGSEITPGKGDATMSFVINYN